MLNDVLLKVYKASYIVENHDFTIGDFLTDKKNYLRFYTPDGWILLEEIQLQGKKRMKIKEFLNGYKS
jgi:methionyl-tRNA formyltransferase